MRLRLFKQKAKTARPRRTGGLQVEQLEGRIAAAVGVGVATPLADIEASTNNDGFPDSTLAVNAVLKNH
jgi:hypothetical protein